MAEAGQHHLLQLGGLVRDGRADAGGVFEGQIAVVGETRIDGRVHVVDLDSDPTKVIEIVEVGKQLLITRGALTTFSVANDVAKYFAIIPAMFLTLYPQLQALNVMGLASPQSAILSAIIFNALVIVALIPLALKGVRYRPASAGALLTRNLVVYGLGGLVAPFIGIKLIDMIVDLAHLA